MTKKKRVFSAEFKFKVVMEALQGLKTINQIASEYEVFPNQISMWKKEFLEQGPELFKKGKNTEAEDLTKERDELHKKIGQLTVEVDWLKNKVALLFPETKGNG